MTGQPCIRRPGATWTSCPCPPCLKHRARVVNLYRLGRIAPSPSAQAWAVIDHLIRDLDWTAGAVASACGLPQRTIASALDRRAVSRRRHKPDGTWSRSTARAILRHAPWPTEGQIGATGTTRRLQALTVTGRTVDDLAKRSGLSPMAVSNLRAGGRQRRVNAAIAAAVRDLYDELWNTPGPSRVATDAAVREGWAPPLAWDDDTIDDPKAKPYRETKEERRHTYLGVDDIAIERVLAGEAIELTQAERAIAVERLAALGLTDNQIGDRIGVWAETVLRTRRRHGIESRWVA